MPLFFETYHRFSIYFLVLLYISAQISIGISISVFNIRLSVADIVLVILLIPTLFLITKSISKDLFLLSIPFNILVSIFSISILMADISFISWSGIKLIGVYILLGHLICAYILTHFILHRLQKHKSLFKPVHIVFFIGLFLALYLFFFLNYDPSYQQTFGVLLPNRISGMMGNPNAYGFYVSCYVLLAISQYTSTNRIAKFQYLFLVFGVFIVALSGSRGSILSFFLATIFICILKPRFIFKINSILAIGVFIPTIITYLMNHLINLSKNHDTLMMKFYRMQPKYLEESIINAKNDNGIMSRLDSYQAALNLWLENPIFGTGLGYFRNHSIKLGLEAGHTIHNTCLWLLTETGVFSLVLVICFFIYLFRVFWLNRTHWYCLGMCSVLIATAAMSQTSEIMYQRHLWILIGIGLAIAKYNQSKKDYKYS